MCGYTNPILLAVTENHHDLLREPTLNGFKHPAIATKLSNEIGTRRLGELGIPGLIVVIPELRLTGNLHQKVRKAQKTIARKKGLKDHVIACLHGFKSFFGSGLVTPLNMGNTITPFNLLEVRKIRHFVGIALFPQQGIHGIFI